MNLFFTGIKHSGKTTFARMTGERLGRGYYDADDLVLPLLGGKTVREFYREFGKPEFQKKEIEAVEKLNGETEEYILSLGGGASDNTPLMETLKKSGRIIYISRPEEKMLPVILKDGIPAFLDKDDVEGSFHALYERRDRIYRDYADLVVELKDYGDKEETEDKILTLLKEQGYVR